MSQFNDPAFGNPPPPKKSSAMMWIIILVVVLLAIPLVCCGGCAGVMWMGMNQLTSEAKRDLAASAEATEALGEIESVTFSIEATGEEQQQRGAGVNAFEVKGSKGNGRIIVNGAGTPNRTSTLELPDGREINIPPTNP